MPFLTSMMSMGWLYCYYESPVSPVDIHHPRLTIEGHLSQSEASIGCELTNQSPVLSQRPGSGNHQHNILPAPLLLSLTTKMGHQHEVLPEMSTSINFRFFYCFF